MTPSILTVIVNWNNYIETKKCLTSLSILTYANLDILIVDNCSTNKEVRQLEKEFPKVHFLYNNDNFGYAGGVNKGILYGLERGYDYIWLLNNDTIVVDPEYLTIIVGIEKKEQCGIVGSLVLNAEDKKVQSEWFTFVPWRGRFVPINKNAEVANINKRTVALKPKEYLNAASMLVNASIFKKSGLWPEDFFLYFEDNTWEDVVRRTNPTVQIFYTSKTYLLHKGAASSGGYKKSTTLDYYDTRNYLYFIKRSYPRWLGYHIFKSVINKVMPKIIRREWLRLKYVLRGFRDFFAGKMGKLE
ncbi:MAG: Galactofuranosyltransferase GlfT1 [Syntrophomonadaceae bacterium]|nr:Galactofuranosyltransferase GlfT1 [Bacillota bacterium]